MSTEKSKTVRVLWLRGAKPPEELQKLLEATDAVTYVDSLDQAVAAMHHETFDAVIAGPNQSLAASPVRFSPEAELILGTVPQGVCIVDENGQLVWSNPKLQNFPDDLREQVVALCTETVGWATAQVASGSTDVFGRRFNLSTPNGQHFELTAIPVIDQQQRITRVAAVVWDITNARRLQERIDAFDNAGRELVKLDAEQITRLDAQERLALLEQKILRYTTNLMHIDNFSVWVLDRKINKLELVLSAGAWVAPNIDLFAQPEGNGITGYVAYRGHSYICPDVQADQRYLPGIEGARSSLTVPLLLHDQVIGVFNVESKQRAAFNEDDRQTMEIFGRYVALSLHILELLVTERSTTTGRLGSDVMAEITGPVNDILNEVESLIEDYIGHDDLRHRLNKISIGAVAIRDSIKAVTTPQGGLVGRAPRPDTVRHDPVLTGKRVLIADDEEVIRETVRDVLVAYGCQVTIANSGEAAIEHLGHDSFDLVLSDIKMPGANGYEVFAAAKDRDPHRPVILMTGFGYDPNHSIIRARQEGLTAVLFKPFKVDQLLGEIRSALKAATHQP